MTELLFRAAVLVGALAMIGRGTVRKMKQNLFRAVGYNAVAIPTAAGVLEPAFGLILRPEVTAITMAGSSVLVAVKALDPQMPQAAQALTVPTAPVARQDPALPRDTRARSVRRYRAATKNQ